MSTIAESLGPIEVLDLEGEKVQLGEVWRDKPAVLVFIRHFG